MTNKTTMKTMVDCHKCGANIGIDLDFVGQLDIECPDCSHPIMVNSKGGLCWKYTSDDYSPSEPCWGMLNVVEDYPGQYTYFCDGHGHFENPQDYAGEEVDMRGQPSQEAIDTALDDNCVFELCDTTNDEMYFPLGIFQTMADVQAEFARYEESGQAISMAGRDGDDDHETITVHKRVFGWTEHGTVELTVHREQFYDEEKDEYSWRKTT